MLEENMMQFAANVIITIHIFAKADYSAIYYAEELQLAVFFSSHIMMMAFSFLASTLSCYLQCSVHSLRAAFHCTRITRLSSSLHNFFCSPRRHVSLEHLN